MGFNSGLKGLIDSAVFSSHSPYRTITGNLHKYTDMKEKSKTIWQLNAYYIAPLVLSTTDIAPNKSHDGLKLLSLRPGPYIVAQKAVISNTSRIFRKLLAV
jgi:hypothetical protein